MSFSNINHHFTLASTKLIIYILFFSLGMIWVKLPLNSIEVRPFQIIGVIVILYAFSQKSIRKQIHEIFLDHIYLFFLAISWSAVCLTTTLLVDTPWSTTDIIKSIAYFMFSISFAACIIDIKNKGHDFNFILAGYIEIFGLLIALIFIVGITINDFLSLIFLSITSADPDIVIFKLFGRTGMFGTQGIDEAAGLRHTLSMGLTVTLFLILDYRNRQTPLFFKGMILIVLLFFILSFQSRSAWLVIIIGFFLKFLHIRKTRYVPRSALIFSLALIPLCLYSLHVLSGMILSRMDNFNSASSRSEYMIHSINLIYTNPWGVSLEEMIETFNSPHNFILDTGLTAGYLGVFLATLLTLAFLKLLISISRSRLSVFLSAAYCALIVRYFTAGSGLPGMGEFIGLSAAFLANYRIKNQMNNS